MKRRTATKWPELPHSAEMELPDGRKLSTGDEFTLHGGGRFRFMFRYDPDGSITAHGPIESPKAKVRSFRPDRVKTVHRTTKARTS